MPRKIKGYSHIGHYTNIYEFDKYMKKIIYGDYLKGLIKVIENEYMGHWYADIYKKGA